MVALRLRECARPCAAPTGPGRFLLGQRAGVFEGGGRAEEDADHVGVAAVDVGELEQARPQLVVGRAHGDDEARLGHAFLEPEEVLQEAAADLLVQSIMVSHATGWASHWRMRTAAAVSVSVSRLTRRSASRSSGGSRWASMRNVLPVNVLSWRSIWTSRSFVGSPSHSRSAASKLLTEGGASALSMPAPNPLRGWSLTPAGRRGAWTTRGTRGPGEA